MKRGLYVVISLVAVILLVAIFVHKRDRLESLTYDPNAWVDAGADPKSTIRLQMVDDLFQRELLEDKTTDELLLLLGEPAPMNYFKNSGFEFMYRLGGSGLFIKSPSYLVIAVEEDRFASATILRD